MSPKNTNEHKSVEKIGGLKQLVKTNQGRNMWAIMTKFNVLPNDPLLKSMSIEQRDFILLSMQEDNLELQRQARGAVSDGDYNDKEFDDIFSSSERDWKIMRDGQDAEDIYKQVVAKTQNPDYEEKLKNRLENAKTNLVDAKNRELSDISDYQAKQIEMALQRAKEKEKQQQVSYNSKVIDYDDMDDWDGEEL